MNDLYGIVKNPCGGLILQGKEGTGVFADACKLAEDVANYGCSKRTSFKNHPDIHLIDLEDGARDIKIEQVEELYEKSNVMPIFSRVNIFVIGHAEFMNLKVQERLLKILEDGANNNLIILCCEERPIETVSNRCAKQKAGRRMTHNEIETAAGIANVPEGVIKAISDDRYEWIEHMIERNTLCDIAHMVNSMNVLSEKRKLLYSLNAMTENKANAVTAKYDKVEQMALIYGIEYIFSDILYYLHTGECQGYLSSTKAEALANLYERDIDWIIQIMQNSINARMQIKRHLFTVNEYFQYVMSCVDKNLCL